MKAYLACAGRVIAVSARRIPSQMDLRVEPSLLLLVVLRSNLAGKLLVGESETSSDLIGRGLRIAGSDSSRFA